MIIQVNHEVPSSKLTWQQKVDLLKMYPLWKMVVSVAMLVHRGMLLSVMNSTRKYMKKS